MSISLENSVTNLLAPYSILSLNIMIKHQSFWKHFVIRVGNAYLWHHCEKKKISYLNSATDSYDILRWWVKSMSRRVHWILFNSIQVLRLSFQYFRRSLQARGNYFLTGGGSKSRWPHFEDCTNLLQMITKNTVLDLVSGYNIAMM